MAVGVTGAVVVLPGVAVSLLLPGRSTIVAIGVCIVLSLAISRLLAALWQRLPGSRDVIFADLLLWGFLRRLRTERRLSEAHGMIVRGATGADPKAIRRHVRGLERISAMVELRDVYTHRHSLRVTRHCEGIAHELGLPADDVAQLRTAAALHDIGKYFTPRSILNKPDRLTDAEFEVIKRHPGEGADLVVDLADPEIVAIIRHHHERLGGTGYPDGLSGDAIPLGARIIAVADTFDAMTSNRAYRTARRHKQALDVLEEEAGVALDARVVEAFAAYYSGRRGVYWSNLASGLSQALNPLRELFGPAALASTLPAIGAAVALSAPMLPSGARAAPARDAASVPAPSRTAAPTSRPVTPAPTRARRAVAPPADVTPGRARRQPAAARPPRRKDRPSRTQHRPTHTGQQSPAPQSPVGAGGPPDEAQDHEEPAPEPPDADPPPPPEPKAPKPNAPEPKAPKPKEPKPNAPDLPPEAAPPAAPPEADPSPPKKPPREK